MSVSFIILRLYYSLHNVQIYGLMEAHFIMCVGGAERLIVDAAMELASLGHKVHIFTSHHDKNRCFEETLSG